jgi:hypothetical protein
MSRQLEQARELRETKRRDALVRALEFALDGALQAQGIQLLGFAAKWDAWECLITLKSEVDGTRYVAFVGAGNIIDAILKATDAAQYDRLRWKEDKYKRSDV